MELIKIFFVLLGALFIGYSISLAERAYTAHKLKREYLRRRFTSAAAIEGRDVKIRGKVEAGARVLEAPFSGRPAVFYKSVIRKRIGVGRFRTVHRDQSSMPFVVADETGKVGVMDRGGRFIVKHDTIRGSSLTGDAVRSLEKRLSLAGLDDIESYEIFEEYLSPGESVIVMGTRAGDEPSSPVQSVKKLPLLVMVCSEEAFIVLQIRAFTRLVFTAICLFVTGAFDLFIAFTINFRAS